MDDQIDSNDFKQFLNIFKEDIKNTVQQSQTFFENHVKLYLEDVKRAFTKSEADHEKIHEDSIVMFKSLMQNYEKLESVTSPVAATQDREVKQIAPELFTNQETKSKNYNESVAIEIPEDTLDGDILLSLIHI